MPERRRAASRKAKRRQSPPWAVRDSGIQGRGVFATRVIREGTWIIEYTGERITHEEADRRYDDDSAERHHTFLFTVDETWCIDASRGGNEARLINHSCEPNCEAVQDEETGRIWICSVRAIHPGEELSYDYGYKAEGEDVATALLKYPCRCGAPGCRGTMLPLDGLRT